MTDPTNPNVIVVSETNEWKEFPKPKENVQLDLIVDPMIYRVADVFLRGKKGVTESFPDVGESKRQSGATWIR
jgi:hypothetical protein